MGIWKAASAGDDVNALDVDRERGLVFTADDYGTVKCFNYPCVAKHAPARKMRGHSSHIMDIKLLHQDGQDTTVVSVGGNDNSVLCWDVVPVPVVYE